MANFTDLLNKSEEVKTANFKVDPQILLNTSPDEVVLFLQPQAGHLLQTHTDRARLGQRGGRGEWRLDHLASLLFLSAGEVLWCGHSADSLNLTDNAQYLHFQTFNTNLLSQRFDR